MRKFILNGFCAALSILPLMSKAQVLTIDYANSLNFDCSNFTYGTYISGASHRATTSLPYVGSGKMKLHGKNSFGSAYEISYPFLYGHKYKITIEGQSQSVNGQNYITSCVGRLDLAHASNSSASCEINQNIPAPTSYTTGNISFPANSYIAPSYTFTMNDNQEVLRVSLVVNSSNLYDLLWIKQITISDITVNPPLFNLSASTESKYCGEEKEVTYTVTNVNNTAGVSGYKFELSGGAWKYPNGTDAPTVITTLSNTITLISGPCNSTATIKGSALMGPGQVNVAAANTKTLSPITFSPIITGPAELVRNQEGFYQILPSTYNYTYTWSCANPYYTWSTNSPDESSVYNGTYNSTNFMAYNVIGGGSGSIPASKIIQLKASGMSCGVNVEGTKNILVKRTFSPFAAFAGNSSITLSDQELAVYPNPANDFITVEFGYEKDDYRLEVYALDGKLLYETIVTSTKTNIDITKYPAGIYFLKATSNGKTQMKKFTKN